MKTRLLVVGVLIGLGACGGGGDNGDVARTTTPTTEVRLSREEYIRQGENMCANFSAELTRIPDPSRATSPEEQLRLYEQEHATFRSFTEQFKGLKAPLADEATSDQLNSLLDQSMQKEMAATAAVRAGEERTLGRLQSEITAVDAQFSEIARNYGFVACSNLFSERTEP